MSQQTDPDAQRDWSLGNILFEKYAVWFDENAQFLGIAGEDVICNQFEQVYFSDEDRLNGLGPQEEGDGQDEEDNESEDDNSESDTETDADSESESLDSTSEEETETEIEIVSENLDSTTKEMNEKEK